jgi:hypothetical protein
MRIVFPGSQPCIIANSKKKTLAFGIWHAQGLNHGAALIRDQHLLATRWEIRIYEQLNGRAGKNLLMAGTSTSKSRTGGGGSVLAYAVVCGNGNVDVL